MKKEKIISVTMGLCLAASLFAGCDKSTGETVAASQLGGGQTQISVENSQGASVSTEGQYCFSFNGYQIMPGTEVQPTLAALGDKYEFIEDFSCAHQGSDTFYMYEGFTIMCAKIDDEIITKIIIDDSLIDCNGLRVGDSFADAKALFGTPVIEDDFLLKYVASDTELYINSATGTGEITEIVFAAGE